MRPTFLLHLALCVALYAFSTTVAFAAEDVPGVRRFHLYAPTLASSGQPGRHQFSQIAAAGYDVVINVASPDSNPGALQDEKQLVEAAGMEYYFLPVTWERPDVNQVVAAVKLLERLQGKAVLVHCYLNTRASFVAYLFRSANTDTENAAEMTTMTKLWKLNRGYEFENSPEWEFLMEDANKLLAK